MRKAGVILVCSFLLPVAAAINYWPATLTAMSVYRLESGALGTDATNGNTLTVDGVTASATCKEGSYSGDFVAASGQRLYIADADLSAGHPFKSGTTNKTATICFWFRADALPGSSQYRGVWGKYVTATNKRSIDITLKGVSASVQSVALAIAYDPAVAGVEKVHGSDLATGTWYHVGISYEDTGKSYRIRIWDDTAGAILGSDLTGTFASNMCLTDAALEIGCYNNDGSHFDGLLDEFVMFNRVLTADEIDMVRNGRYGIRRPIVSQ